MGIDTLQILLLGPPEVLWQGQPWKITRRTPRALLFYLAVEGEVNREELCSLFWPDEPEETRARANLRVTLNRLKGDLPDPNILEVKADIVSLNRSWVEIDASKFMEWTAPALRTAAQLPVPSALPERLVQQLTQAAGLWRSTRFLDSFPPLEHESKLDSWLARISRRFVDANLRVQTCLAYHAAVTGDLDAAIHWAQEGLKIDPWAEELSANVLRWKFALGRTRAAAGFARALQVQYNEENEELSEELAELIRRASGNEHVKSSGMEGWPGALLVQAPLADRNHELKTLRAAMARGGILWLSGEAGSGKTRLIYEFYRALEQRPRLLYLNGVQSDAGLLFQPLIDALRREILQEEWLRLAEPWRQQMSALLPELADRLPPAPSPEIPLSESLRGRLFEALRQLLLLLAKRERILLVLDAAQWCDDATLSALAYLVERHFFWEHGLLLVASRVEENPATLKTFFNRQRNSAWFHCIELKPLTLAEVNELARQTLGRTIEETAARRLLDATGGNPQFLLETLYALLEYAPSAGNLDGLARLPVASSLHALLRERLDWLSLPARQVATAAAILGSEFDPPLLQKITLMDAEAIARGLDELQGTHLIQLAQGGANTAYQFKYGLARDVICWEQGPAQLRLLHLRAARALESQPDENKPPADLLAQHYEAAGELPTAIAYWLKAGRHSRAAFAIHEAELFFQAADRLAQRVNSVLADDVLYQLYTHQGEMAAERGDTATMEQVYSRLLRSGEERQSAWLVGSGLSGLGWMHSLRNDPLRAMEFFQRAAFHLEQIQDPVDLVQVYNRQGWYMVNFSRFEDAIGLFQKALDLAGETEEPRLREVIASTAYYLGMAYNLIGWPVKAQEMAARALSADRTAAKLYGHLVMSAAKYYQGEYTASLEHIRLGLQVAQQTGNARAIGYFRGYQVRTELAMGLIDATWGHLISNLNFMREHGFQDLLSANMGVMGDVYSILGDYERAIDAYREGIRLGEGKWDSLGIQPHLALVLANRGQKAEGWQLAEDAYDKALQMNLGIVLIPALTSLALLSALDGRFEEAVGRVNQLRKDFEERHFTTHTFVEPRILAQVAMQSGDIAEIQKQANAAIQIARQIGNPFWELRGYQILHWTTPLNEAAVRRLHEILEMIDRRVRHPDLRALAEEVIRRGRVLISET